MKKTAKGTKVALILSFIAVMLMSFTLRVRAEGDDDMDKQRGTDDKPFSMNEYKGEYYGGSKQDLEKLEALLVKDGWGIFTKGMSYNEEWTDKLITALYLDSKFCSTLDFDKPWLGRIYFRIDAVEELINVMDTYPSEEYNKALDKVWYYGVIVNYTDFIDADYTDYGYVNLSVQFKEDISASEQKLIEVTGVLGGDEFKLYEGNEFKANDIKIVVNGDTDTPMARFQVANLKARASSINTDYEVTCEYSADSGNYGELAGGQTMDLVITVSKEKVEVAVQPTVQPTESSGNGNASITPSASDGGQKTEEEIAKETEQNQKLAPYFFPVVLGLIVIAGIVVLVIKGKRDGSID